MTMDVNIAVDYFGDEAVLKLGGHLNTNTAAEGTLRIVNASDDIREVFDITGLIDVFDVE